MRLNALWAIKNALFNAMPREKHMIIEELGWDYLAAWVGFIHVLHEY